MNKDIINNLSSNLKKYYQASGISKAVIWLSWWIDSACTLMIWIKAFWKHNITAILMPASWTSSDNNFNDALNLAKDSWVNYEVINIDSYLDNYSALPWWNNDICDMNIKARIRMTILYHAANKLNALVLWTWNKTEIEIWYWTKYWDFWVDIEVLGKLYKTDIFKLAKELDLPSVFITKKPSAELYADQSDEEEIGYSYEEIDQVLKDLELWNKTDPKFDDLINRINNNKHKTKAIPCLDI